MKSSLTKVVVGYFGSWNVWDRAYFPKDIPVDHLTHVNYAFATVAPDGACTLLDPWPDYQRPFSAAESVDGVADVPGQALMGNFNQLRKLKAANPQLGFLISIRGWSDSTHFSTAAATPESRARFVGTCIDMLLDGDLPSEGRIGGKGVASGVFDGIDIDWEYPVHPGETQEEDRPEDKVNATLLFREFRRQLDEREARTGRHHLLTAAIPGGNRQSTLSYELAEIAQTLSWINVMTYDTHGPWQSYSAFNSPFETDPLDPIDPQSKPAASVVGTVRYFLSEGVPPEAIVIGVPFYARQYARVLDVDRGLYQSFDNAGLDGSSWESSDAPTYRDLVDVGRILEPSSGARPPRGRNGFTRYWSDAAKVPWLYKPPAAGSDDGLGTFISYDDPTSIAQRVELIRELGLRGAMIWEIS
ncbi:MAG TPA: glycoside hydrolase family 18 protein, partial [Candidatus Limnocylindrales bacterium]|nr:glycoside hydrolase family 18 protein [Candidatus Limnocylindrales bacterium]